MKTEKEITKLVEMNENELIKMFKNSLSNNNRLTNSYYDSDDIFEIKNNLNTSSKKIEMRKEHEIEYDLKSEYINNLDSLLMSNISDLENKWKLDCYINLNEINKVVYERMFQLNYVLINNLFEMLTYISNNLNVYKYLKYEHLDLITTKLNLVKTANGNIKTYYDDYFDGDLNENSYDPNVGARR